MGAETNISTESQSISRKTVFSLEPRLYSTRSRWESRGLEKSNNIEAFWGNDNACKIRESQGGES